uniref:Uncharacterized protein n=1 Tax=Caenorhabditis japonica TaxID=281687 RepID=A0A8R1DWD7_CAEJA
MPRSNQSTPKKQQPAENYNQLLSEFVQKGGQNLQKTFIKKLWSVHQDLIENANPSTLRMIFWSPSLTSCPEGVKLLAMILLKIGVVAGLKLLEKRVFEEFPITEQECQRYGEVFKSAWKFAYEDENFDLVEELETKAIIVFCQHAIYGKIAPAANKFRRVLAAFATEKKLDKNMDKTMTSILNGCLFKALDSRNHIVQASAAKVLYLFYPLVGDSSDDMAECLANQHRHMADLLSSDIINIRAEATKSVLKAMAEYWLIIPKHSAKEIFSFIIDTLSRDTVVAVRVAVFEGLNEMAFVPACLSVFEHALKCVACRGVQDKSERVRLTALQLLARLKNHKFISVFHIIERDDVIAKMDTESVESCRQQLVPIMHTLLPISSKDDLDEGYYRPRVNYILGKSRLALLSYFRLLGPMNIINAKQATDLIGMLITWAYRYIRNKEGDPLAEDTEKFQRARGYLECALVIYMSCKGIMNAEENLKAKIEKMFGKIVKEIFEKYGTTPMLGTATAISSVIPKEHLKSIGSVVVVRLIDDDVPAEAVEPFLESAMHINPDSVFDSLDTGLDVLVDLFAESKKSRAKKRSTGNPEEIMETTLSRLKHILRSPITANLVAMRDIYKQKINQYMTKIDFIRYAIEERLKKEESDHQSLSDSVLLSTLEVRFILPVYVACNGSPDAEERAKLFEWMEVLISWFDEKIVQQMTTFGEHNHEFLVELSRSFLECINVTMMAFDFATRPLEYEDEEDKPEEEEGKKEQKSVVETVATCVLSFCNSVTPVELFAPVLRVAASLCDETYSDCHPQMVNVLRFVPKWINKQCRVCDTETENPFEKEKEPAEALRQFQKRVSDTDCWDETSAQRMIFNFVLFSIVWLIDTADESEFEDPRREEYVSPHFVSFAVNKFILKEKTLTEDFLDTISKNYLQEGNSFFNPEEREPTSKLLTKLAALSQLLRILERNSKFCSQRIAECIELCVTRALDYFSNAEDLDTVENHVMNSLSILLDVDLPEGF